MHPNTSPGHVPGLAGLAAGAGALLAITMAAPVHADCLASTVRCQYDVQSTTAAGYTGQCSTPTFGGTGIDFNVPARTLDVWEAEVGIGAELFLDDEYTVHGPVAGAPINLHLRVRFHGRAASYGEPEGAGRCTIGVSALAPVAGDPTPVKIFQASLNSPTGIAFTDSVDFVVARTVGVPVGIEMHLLAEHGYDEQVYADFAFVDLPPGMSVTSCKGYSQDQPVPAIARSWGSVKATYR